jgi:hypothetical protein
MDFPDGDAYNDAYAPGFPYGTVDCTPQSTDPQNTNKVGFYRGHWQSVANARKAIAPKYQLNMTHSFNSATKTVTITLTGKALAALTGDYNFNVYIVEDSVTGPNGSGYSQKNFYANNASYTSHPYYSLPATINGYIHNKVLRAMLGGTWGSAAVTNPAANSTKSMTFTYVVPTSVKMPRMKIVGLVQKSSTNPNDREILNSVQAKFHPNALGVGTVAPAVADVQVFPNPATNNIHVAGIVSGQNETKLTLVNAVGQIVFEKTYQAGTTELRENIQVNHLSNGVYYLNMVSDAGRNTEKVVIAH